MKRYLVIIRKYDGSEYSVDDRVTGKHYFVGEGYRAFKDYPGTIQELASDIEIIENYPVLGKYGDAYKIKKNEKLGTPELFLELNSLGRHKQYMEKLFRAGVK